MRDRPAWLMALLSSLSALVASKLLTIPQTYCDCVTGLSLSNCSVTASGPYSYAIEPCIDRQGRSHA